MTSSNELEEQFLPLTSTGSFYPFKSILTVCLRKLCVVFFSLQHFQLVESRSEESKAKPLTTISEFFQTHKGV